LPIATPSANGATSGRNLAISISRPIHNNVLALCRVSSNRVVALPTPLSSPLFGLKTGAPAVYRSSRCGGGWLARSAHLTTIKAPPVRSFCATGLQAGSPVPGERRREAYAWRRRSAGLMPATRRKARAKLETSV
jgi:hypothetical protein